MKEQCVTPRAAQLRRISQNMTNLSSAMVCQVDYKYSVLVQDSASKLRKVIDC